VQQSVLNRRGPKPELGIGLELGFWILDWHNRRLGDSLTLRLMYNDEAYTLSSLLSIE
jgi:hypothetical protein